MIHAAPLPPETLTLFETVPDLYLILAPDLTILTASNAYLKATYKEREKIKGKHLFEAFPDNPDLPDSKSTANLKYSLECAIKYKKPHQMAIQRFDVSKSGLKGDFEEKYWLPTNTPVLDEEGNIQYIIHKVNDVTDQLNTLKLVELREQQIELLSKQQIETNADLLAARVEADRQLKEVHNILMDAPAMICVFEGPQHVFKLVNPLYQQLVGDRPLLGKPIAQAMPELVGQPIFSLLDQVYRTGETFYANEMIVQLDHDNSGGLGENYYNFIYQATHDVDGNINGIMVFAYEVTVLVDTRKQVEQRELALQELNEKLEAAHDEVKTSNEELLKAQQALQYLNRELENRVEERTRELQLSKVEAELQKAMLEHFFMQAPAPVCVLNGPHLVYELVNPAYQSLFSGRELLGKPVLEALPEIKGQPIHTILTEVYETGKTYEGKETLIPLSRSAGAPVENGYFNFTYQARYDSKGEIDGILVYAFEVTDQVIARKLVEESAKRLKLITDSLPVLIGYLDKDEKYRFANKAYESWFNQNPDDLLGRPVRDVVGEKAYAGVKKYIDRALTGERLDFEATMPYRENFVKHIRTSYVPDLQGGEVVGFYTLVTDITEQVEALKKIEERERETKALAEELTTANQQLRHINADLDNFIYAASHDLKAPISNIEGLMLILLDTLPVEVLKQHGMTEVTDMIGDSIARFKRTIEHLTEVTKLQKENNQDAIEVDLAQVIKEVKLDLSQQLEEAQAQLEIKTGNCADIHFSEKNLRSVIYNLLSNAIKYRSPERTPKITIQCSLEGDYTILTVKDNGLGMDLSGNPKLFTMFGRLHDHVEGSGVGLYMVKKMVENARGRIKVDSEVGVGTTFKIYLKN